LCPALPAESCTTRTKLGSGVHPNARRVRLKLGNASKKSHERESSSRGCGSGVIALSPPARQKYTLRPRVDQTHFCGPNREQWRRWVCFRVTDWILLHGRRTRASTTARAARRRRGRVVGAAGRHLVPMPSAMRCRHSAARAPENNRLLQRLVTGRLRFPGDLINTIVGPRNAEATSTAN
jgi:hypothetical protein